MLMSATHLGKPWRFYRGFNNLRHSPVCREGLGMLLYMVFAGVHLLAMLPENSVFTALLGEWGSFPTVAATTGYLALIAGAVGLYYMYRCYRIPARPFWNHWQTGSAFLGTALTLGGVVLGVIGVPTLMLIGGDGLAILKLSLVSIVIGAALEGVGLWRHGLAMDKANNEGSVSHYIQCTLFGKSYMLRNLLTLANLVLAAALLSSAELGVVTLVASALLCGSIMATALIGRCLFYVLVVPTTMPGAFFWKNKDFEEHARDIGLANMPQVGVVAHAH
jgi:DMSO reductase anchor subunit